MVRGRKGEFKDMLDELDQQGFRARVDGELRDLSEPVLLDRRKNHTIEAVVDRVILKPSLPSAGAPEPLAANRRRSRLGASRELRRAQAPPSPVEKRLDAAVTKALQMANGLVLIGVAKG